jgi:formyl-CoA transferase
MAWPLPHATLGEAAVIRTPLTLEGQTPGIRRPVPGLGEHADEILAEAGLTTDEIAALRAAGALGE